MQESIKLSINMEGLNLEVLAPYLPFGVKLLLISSFKDSMIIDNWGIRNCSDYPVITYENGKSHGRMLSEIKPILRPLSDLTKEIEHNGENFVPLSRLDFKEEYHVHFADCIVKATFDISYSIIQKLFEWHFDVFKLIDKNLAANYHDLKVIELKKVS